jgi:predicted nuclease with TOPRIM domain
VSDQENKPWEWGDKGVPHNPINHYAEGTRFLCCGYDGHMAHFSPGDWVRYSDYARLKEEVERLKKPASLSDSPTWNAIGAYAETKEEVERLKAELAKSEEHNAALCERMLDLNSELHTCSCANANMNKHKEDYARLKSEVEAQAKRWAESEDLISHYKQQRDEVINDCQCSRLKAQVERLTKAGDEVIREWSSGDEKAAKNFMKALVIWNAAKEGKDL